MGYVDCAPDGYTDENGSRTVVGGAGNTSADALAALADASDATYVVAAGVVPQSWNIGIRFATPTLPAGAAITSVQLVYRYSHFTNSNWQYEFAYAKQLNIGIAPTNPLFPQWIQWSPDTFPFYFATFSPTPTDFYGTSHTYASNNGLHHGYTYANSTNLGAHFYAWIAVDRNIASNAARIYRVFLRVYYDEQPILNIVSPTGPTVQVARPQFQWTWFDPEGGTQERVDVRIYKRADADNPAFMGLEVALDPNFPPEYFSQFIGSSHQHLVNKTFAENGVEYSAFIRARNALVWPWWAVEAFPHLAPTSEWDRVDFTTDFDGPQAPTITATADPADHSISVDVVGIDNMMGFNQSTFEQLTTDGWTAGANTTIVNTATTFHVGARSLQLTRTTSIGDATTSTAANLEVVGNTAYTAFAYFRSAVTPRTPSVLIIFSDATGGIVGFSSSSHAITTVAGGWRKAMAWGTAPPTAVRAGIVLTVVGCAVSEVHYVDTVGLFPGTRTTLLVDNVASLEDGNTTGWTGGTNTTIAAVKIDEDAYDRDWVLRLTRTTSTGNGTANTATGTSGIPVLPSTVYTFAARFRAPVTARTVQATLTWYTAAGAVISTVNGSSLTDSTTVWAVSLLSNTTSPGTAAFASITVTVTNMAVSENHYVDGIGLWPGTTVQSVPSWNLGGFISPDPMMHQMELQRSLDAGTTWEMLPEQRVIHVPLAQSLHYHDFEIPSAGTGHYRARIIAPNADGIVMNSAWSKMVNASLPTRTSYFLRDPLDSTGELNMVLRVVSMDLEHPKPHSQGFPLESDASAVTHRGIRNPDVRLVIDLLTEEDYMMFHELLDTGNVLLFQDVIGHQYYLQLTSLSEERLRALKLPSEMWPMRHAHRATAVFASVDRDTSFALHSGSGGHSMSHA